MFPCDNSACDFVGQPIPDAPPLYVACVVDDVVYFSANDSFKQWVEAGLASQLNVDYMGPVSYYLGV